MSEERKNPGVVFWSAVTLAVLLAYLLNLGPACWFNQYTNRS